MRLYCIVYIKTERKMYFLNLKIRATSTHKCLLPEEHSDKQTESMESAQSVEGHAAEISMDRRAVDNITGRCDYIESSILHVQ